MFPYRNNYVVIILVVSARIVTNRCISKSSGIRHFFLCVNNCIGSIAMKMKVTVYISLIAMMYLIFSGFIGPVVSSWTGHAFGFGWMTTGAATISFVMVSWRQYNNQQVSVSRNIDCLSIIISCSRERRPQYIIFTF